MPQGDTKKSVGAELYARVQGVDNVLYWGIAHPKCAELLPHTSVPRVADVMIQSTYYGWRCFGFGLVPYQQVYDLPRAAAVVMYIIPHGRCSTLVRAMLPLM